MADAIWRFLTETHDPRQVFAAAVACALAAACGFGALRFAQAGGRGRFWTLLAAAIFAAGLWTTHFTAMVGFRPDLALGFSAASLAVSVFAAGAAGLALAWGARGRSVAGRLRAALAATGATALMHHAGVAGLTGCAVSASPAAVLPAVLLGAALFAAALEGWARARRPSPTAAALLTLGVATLHFVWMGGVSLSPDAAGPTGLTRADVAPMTLVAALTLALAMAALTAGQSRAAGELRRLAAVAAGLRDGAMLLDPRGRAEWVNPAFVRLTGHALADLARLRPLAALPEEPAGVAACAELAEALRRGTAATRELRLRDADGAPGVWANVSVAPLPGGGALVTLHDLSEVRARAAAADAARAEADRTRARLIAAMEAAPIGMAMFDAGRALVACNDAFRALAPGLCEALRPGAPQPEDAAEERARLARPGEDEVRLPDGRWVWRRVEFGPQGEIMAARMDVTERKAREAELEAARDRAQAASRAKSEFISVMSHELRTPLNGVLGFAGLLGSEALSDRQRACVGHIRNSGELLLGILNDILDLAALDADRLALEEGRVDLDALLETLRAEHGAVARAKGLRFSANRDADAPRAVAGDATRLAQALRALLSNAVKFTDAGEVRLRLRAGARSVEREEVIYEVIDTGPGVAPEAQARLFDAFAQADGSATRRHGGVGIGLTIAGKLATLMGGGVEVESRPGRGSTFRLRVPHRRAETVAERPALRFRGRGAA